MIRENGTRAKVKGSRITIREGKARDLVASAEVWISPVIIIIPNASLVRVEFLRKSLHMAVKGRVQHLLSSP